MSRVTWLGVLALGTAFSLDVNADSRRLSAESIAARKDLQGEDIDRAVGAATKLGELRQTDALEVLLDALSLGLHPRVAAAAIDAVGANRASSAVDVLLYYAHSRNPDVRARAVTALGALSDGRCQAAWRGALGDAHKDVRAAAIKIVGARKDVGATEALITLLKKGDAAVPATLAVVATPESVRRVAELIGEVQDRLLAEFLGLVLLRGDLGKEEIYVELIRTLGKIPGNEPVIGLTNFISATPENPPRQSRREAQLLVEQRVGGGE